jgi:hypothetical protein
VTLDKAKTGNLIEESDEERFPAAAKKKLEDVQKSLF